MVVGVDVHKYCHTAVAMNPWGQVKSSLDFSNDTLDDCVDWLNRLGQKENIIVALEDANGYGVHIVEKLSKHNFPLRYVPAILTERDRRRSTQRDKSDYLDAKRVGKVILTKYEETLPAKESIADEKELNIARAMNLLLSERRDLVKQKTIVKNQLHALLHQYYGDHYQNSFKKPFSRKGLAFYLGDLSQARPEPSAKRIVKQGVLRRIGRLKLLEKQIVEIDGELEKTSRHHRPVQVLQKSIHGCGMLTACSIIAEIYTIRRFGAKAQLAKYAGVAPTARESGSKNKVYTNPFGNRLLNKALHVIALSQIAVRGDDKGKVYYQKKLSEGKTKLWALRCLKRQMCNRVFQTLKQAEIQKEDA